VLYDAAPSAGCRREAEADDHGEVGDPLDRDGPGLLLKVEVPPGVHRMSLYLLSPNGHDTGERNRDYVIEVKPWQGNLKDLDAAPALARARGNELWTGVWKQFVVSGPATYGVSIRRNASFNTILPGIFLDKLAGPKSKYDGSRAAWLPVPVGGIDSPPSPEGREKTGDNAQADAAQALWQALDGARARPAAVPVDQALRVLAYRAMSASRGMRTGNAPPAQNTELLARWRSWLPLCLAEDRQRSQDAARRCWTAMVARTPGMAGVKH